MTGLKKYFGNQIFENVVFFHIISPQISPFFHYISYMIHIPYFLQIEHFRCMWYFSSKKNFNFNVYALPVVPFATAAAVYHKISII